jgi:hypothetical protein
MQSFLIKAKGNCQVQLVCMTCVENVLQWFTKTEFVNKNVQSQMNWLVFWENIAKFACKGKLTMENLGLYKV